jgi:hypothetical protein
LKIELCFSRKGNLPYGFIFHGAANQVGAELGGRNNIFPKKMAKAIILLMLLFSKWTMAQNIELVKASDLFMLDLILRALCERTPL